MPTSARHIALPGSDASVPALPATPKDAGATLEPVAPGPTDEHTTVAVQVITRPEGANLYEGTHYRGPSGTEIDEPLGTKLVITCRLSGYKPGTVEIEFTGKSKFATCVMQRIKICINGIKNPFDDCEIAPPAEPSGSGAADPPPDQSP